MLGGGVDAATLVAASGAGPPPPDCRWSRRPHRGATACRLLERDGFLLGSVVRVCFTLECCGAGVVTAVAAAAATETGVQETFVVQDGD